MDLRILIGVGNYPKLSESYIEAEIRFLLRSGLQVEVWSDRVGSPGTPDLVPVHRGPVAGAIAAFRPHAFHAHYLTFHTWALEEAGRRGVPCTVRGHSFDFGAARAREVASRPWIRRVWLFPHFAREAAHPKIDALPVAFDSELYRPAPAKERRLVYRTAAAKPGKGLEDFFAISRRLPGFAFDLTANNVIGDEPYLPFLEKEARAAGISFSADVGREEAVRRMNRAGIYLDTSESTRHPFGMPISIAEALATGCFVLARWSPAAEEYLGGDGRLYRTVDEAAGIIRETETWPAEKWEATARTSFARAALFADHAVLPAEITFWKTLAS